MHDYPYLFKDILRTYRSPHFSHQQKVNKKEQKTKPKKSNKKVERYPGQGQNCNSDSII